MTTDALPDVALKNLINTLYRRLEAPETKRAERLLTEGTLHHLERLRTERDEWRARFENVIDEHAEGAWMARAIGAEAERDESGKERDSWKLTAIDRAQQRDDFELQRDRLSSALDAANALIAESADEKSAMQLRHDDTMTALSRSTDRIADQRDAAARERDLLATWMRNLPSPDDIELARLEIERSPDVIAAIRKLNEASE